MDTSVAVLHLQTPWPGFWILDFGSCIFAIFAWFRPLHEKRTAGQANPCILIIAPNMSTTTRSKATATSCVSSHHLATWCVLPVAACDPGGFLRGRRSTSAYFQIADDHSVLNFRLVLYLSDQRDNDEVHSAAYFVFILISLVVLLIVVFCPNNRMRWGLCAI